MRHFAQTPALFGASPGTGNLGVDALCWSALTALAERGHCDVSVFGHGAGVSKGQVPGAEAATHYRLIGTQVGRRIWCRNHVARIELESRARLPGNPVIEAVRSSSAVLDVSGGDSFTDLYGDARFRAVTLPKRLALRLDRPLILLPQTYGPFESEHKRLEAKRLVSQATLAFARDPDSFKNLQELAGEHFDATRHRQGVDMAFSLPVQAPKNIESQLNLISDPARPLIGINVSGLLGNRPAEAAARFGIGCDYMGLIEELIVRLLASSQARIVLIPHVLRPHGHYEADQDACAQLLRRISPRRGDAATRVSTVMGNHDACEVKWIISQMDWFCGTRMHATIAALSSGVPAAALAYSLKTRGVFARADQAEAVVDLRNCHGREALDQLLGLWQHREKHASKLAQALPRIRSEAATQMNHVAALVSRQQRLAA
jgi:polysaccharide pyruvyl transferase WcaK-like protein